MKNKIFLFSDDIKKEYYTVPHPIEYGIPSPVCKYVLVHASPGVTWQDIAKEINSSELSYMTSMVTK
jgi:hypothetical protein